MNDLDFKNTLIKALEQESKTAAVASHADKLLEVILTLPRTNLYVEETGIFTRIEWNTYCSILHIQVPLTKRDAFLKEADYIFNIAKSIYGRQGDNYLTDIDIGILVEHYDVVDLSAISVTDVITKAISDAELLMQSGKYDDAFDRVHTAFHGYFRKVLDNKGISYEESETLAQLYSKLHSEVAKNIANPDIADLVRTAMRSGSGVISSINDLRNRFSLAHPNAVIVDKREAELAIKLIKDLSDYINLVI